MPNRYYPKNQRFYGKYTQGGEYSDAAGQEYIGPYHYFGAQELIMTGAFPQDDSKVLMPYKNTNFKTPDAYFYDFLTTLNLSEFKSPKSKRPKPGPNDIQNGYMLRYFLKLKNDISSPVFDMPQYDNTDDTDGNNIDGFRYQKMSIRWKIDGPRYDQYHDKARTNIKAYGIEDTNRRTVFQKNLEMPGLSEALGDLTEHSRFSKIKKAEHTGIQKDNLETDGTDFVLMDGTPYIGFYHIHPHKGAMAGKRHSDKIKHARLLTLGQYQLMKAHGTLSSVGGSAESSGGGSGGGGGGGY